MMVEVKVVALVVVFHVLLPYQTPGGVAFEVMPKKGGGTRPEAGMQAGKDTLTMPFDKMYASPERTTDATGREPGEEEALLLLRASSEVVDAEDT